MCDTSVHVNEIPIEIIKLRWFSKFCTCIKHFCRNVNITLMYQALHWHRISNKSSSKVYDMCAFLPSTYLNKISTINKKATESELFSMN